MAHHSPDHKSWRILAVSTGVITLIDVITYTLSLDYNTQLVCDSIKRQPRAGATAHCYGLYSFNRTTLSEFRPCMYNYPEKQYPLLDWLGSNDPFQNI